MSDGALRAFHRAEADRLIDAGSVDVARIAAHLDGAGDHREAAPWHAEVARRHWLAERGAEALDASDRALRGGLDDDERASVWMLRVEVLDALGDVPRAHEAAREALRAAPAGEPVWFRAAAAVVVTAMRLGEADHLRAVAKALDEALRRPLDDGCALGLAPAVLALLRAGQYALADAIIARLDEVPTESAPPDLGARVAAARALRATFRGDPQSFLVESERAAAAYARLGEQRLALLHRNNAGFARVSLGDGEGARVTLDAVRAEARALGFARAATVALHNLGPALLLCGDVENARAVETAALDEAEALGDAQLAAMARLYLARVELAAQRPDDATAHVDAALQALAQNPGARVLGLALRARARITLGRLDLARHDIDVAAGTLAVLGTVEEGDAELHLAAAELASATHATDAPARWDEARARLLARAERVDAAGRLRFLYGVPDHAATLGSPPATGVENQG
jgi:tetratricopeptide (TPR) repeat protein